MKRWLWFFASILISTGVYFTIRYGLRPKPIPVMKPSEFASTQEIGAVVYKRLRQEIRAERVLILGSTPELQGYADVWSGIIKSALADQVNIPILFQHEGLQPAQSEGGMEVVTFNDHMVQSGELLNLVKSRMGPGKLVVIHSTTNEVSHLIKGSLSRGLDTVSKHPVLAISTLALSLRPEEIENLQTECLNQEPDGRIKLQCVEVRVSRIMLKKKLSPDKFWAVMERHGLKEYLIFIHR